MVDVDEEVLRLSGRGFGRDARRRRRRRLKREGRNEVVDGRRRLGKIGLGGEGRIWVRWG